MNKRAELMSHCLTILVQNNPAMSVVDADAIIREFVDAQTDYVIARCETHNIEYNGERLIYVFKQRNNGE